MALANLARDWLGRNLGFATNGTTPKEPELAYDPSRPTTGFFATLTAGQKKRVLAYKGPDNLGPDTHKLAR